MKADDDSFMVMENVRQMLYQYKPDTALNFGLRMVEPGQTNDGYMQGGAYILSRKAVEKFVSLYPNFTNNQCYEDVFVGEYALKM